MGVIRWEELADGAWQGYVTENTGIMRLIYAPEVGRWILRCPLPHFGGALSVSVSVPSNIDLGADLRQAKRDAEFFLNEWLETFGLMSKAEYETRMTGVLSEKRRISKDYDDLYERYKTLNISLGDRYLEIRDLVDENAALKEKIGAAFGDIDDAITALTRKVDDIVADSGVARTWSWDVPVDQWWNGGKPKQRTEADWLNADIDENGYVTFRDGGEA